METARMFSLLSACVYALTAASAAEAAPHGADSQERGPDALRAAPADDLFANGSSARPGILIQSKHCERGCLAA
ncbi:MAG: hypothetical protein IKI21_02875 [Oscillospiraceae bacterium]|nr:hypothetical protein [Oscillospiraceae bacterium]